MTVALTSPQNALPAVLGSSVSGQFVPPPWGTAGRATSEKTLSAGRFRLCVETLAIAGSAGLFYLDQLDRLRCVAGSRAFVEMAAHDEGSVERINKDRRHHVPAERK